MVLPRKKQVLAFVCVTAMTFVYAQDTSLVLTPVAEPVFHSSQINLTTLSFTPGIESVDMLLRRSPSEADSVFCKKHSKLIHTELTAKNAADYNTLALSLYQLSRNTEAEPMLLKIVDSKLPFFVGTTYHSSDVAGDKTVNSYGYGSFTSNHKNYACRYLAKIYLETKQYEKALHFVKLADHKYIIEYNCGTGHMWYQGELDGLYAACFDGLGFYDHIIDMLLPRYDNRNNGLLIKAIKKVYTPEQISEHLKIAGEAVVFVADTIPSAIYTIENWGEPNESQTEIKFISGKATTMLFGRELILQDPRFKNGDVATKEVFVKTFRESDFYRELAGQE